MGASRQCSFCQRPRLYEPRRGVHVCERCAVRIGELACDRGASASVWTIREQPASARPASSRSDVEEAFRSFKEGVAAEIAADDTRAHADLALAYAEMGLSADALREASLVLGRAADVDATETALRAVLSPSLVKPSGLRELKRRLRR